MLPWGPEWTLEKAAESLEGMDHYQIYNSLRDFYLPAFCQRRYTKPNRGFPRKWHNIPYTESPDNHPLIEDLTYQLHNYCKISSTKLLDIDERPDIINIF